MHNPPSRTVSLRAVRASVMALVLGMPALASADVITQARAFDLSFAASVGGGLAVDVLPFNRFNESLGTLDRVDVTIDASLLMQLFLPLSFIPTPTGMLPIPYAYDIRTSLDVEGQASDFLLTPQVMLLGGAPGGSVQLPLVALVGIQHAFSYTATSDTIGFAPVDTTYAPVVASFGSVVRTSPVFSSGTRDDFVAPVANVPLIALPRLVLSAPTFAGAQQPGTFAGTVAATGLMTVTYTYTPTPPPTPVPESGTAMLVVGGLLTLIASRRRSARRT